MGKKSKSHRKSQEVTEKVKNVTEKVIKSRKKSRKKSNGQGKTKKITYRIFKVNSFSYLPTLESNSGFVPFSGLRFHGGDSAHKQLDFS